MIWNKKAPDSVMMSSNHHELERENKLQQWKPMFHFVKSVKLPWALIAVCTVLNLAQSTLTLMFPQYTEQIYAGNFSMQIAITAVAVILGQAILTAAIQFVAGYTSHLNKMRFQNYIWRKLSRLPLSFYEKNEPRDLISRTTDDTQSLSEFFSYGISSIISTFYCFLHPVFRLRLAPGGLAGHLPAAVLCGRHHRGPRVLQGQQPHPEPSVRHDPLLCGGAALHHAY